MLVTLCVHLSLSALRPGPKLSGWTVSADYRKQTAFAIKGLGEINYFPDWDCNKCPKRMYMTSIYHTHTLIINKDRKVKRNTCCSSGRCTFEALSWCNIQRKVRSVRNKIKSQESHDLSSSLNASAFPESKWPYFSDAWKIILSWVLCSLFLLGEGSDDGIVHECALFVTVVSWLHIHWLIKRQS